MEFTREKITGLGGFPQVIYTAKDTRDRFLIIADHEGVKFEGESEKVTGYEAMNGLAKTISDAFKDHMNLRKHAVRTLAGQH